MNILVIKVLILFSRVVVVGMLVVVPLEVDTFSVGLSNRAFLTLLMHRFAVRVDLDLVELDGVRKALLTRHGLLHELDLLLQLDIIWVV